MIVLSAVVVIVAFVVCLALAASSSPVYGFNAKAEMDGPRQDAPAANPAVSARMGLVEPAVPMVKAAGMQ